MSAVVSSRKVLVLAAAMGAIALLVAALVASGPASAKGGKRTFKVVTDQNLTGTLVVLNHKGKTHVFFDADTLLDCASSDIGGHFIDATVADTDEMSNGSDKFDMINNVNISGTHTTALGSIYVTGHLSPPRRGNSLNWARAKGKLRQTSYYATSQPYSTDQCDSGIVRWHTKN